MHATSSESAGVTVVIPTCNGAATLHECLDGWCSQTVRPERILIIDSESTDSTLDIAGQFPLVDVLAIARSEFNHGATRNFGISQSHTEFTVMTVQDAVPADQDVLGQLLDGVTSERTAGVCGCQIVKHRPDCNPVDWFSPVSIPRNRTCGFGSRSEFEQLSPQARKSACSWDNVLALYRTDVVADRVAFRTMKFGEDAFWAIDALGSGFELTYCPVARVHHYHHESADYAERRMLEELYLDYDAFGLAPAPFSGWKRNLAAIRTLIRRSPGRLIYWAWYNFNRNRGYRRAVTAFQKALAQGRAEVDELMRTKCGLPTLGRVSSMAEAAASADVGLSRPDPAGGAAHV